MRKELLKGTVQQNESPRITVFSELFLLSRSGFEAAGEV